MPSLLINFPISLSRWHAARIGFVKLRQLPQQRQDEDMRSYNRATVLGHVGNDVVLRYTQAGQPVTNLSLATNERRKDGPTVTTWHRVVLWGKLAELAERHVKKGEAVYVEGPLSSRQWRDDQGETHTRTELTAREMIFLGSRATEVVSPSEESSDPGEETGEVVEEIPF